MRVGRKWVILIAAAVLTAGLILAMFASQPREPSYQGKTLSQWIDSCDPAVPLFQLPKANPQEVEAVCTIGTNALPFLLEWIRDEPEPSKAKQFLYRLLARLHFQIPEDPSSRADRAAVGFGILGPLAGPAIPELTRMACASSDNGEFGRLVFALAYIGPTAFPAIAEALRNTNAVARYQAISAVNYSMQKFGTNAYPLLIECLDDPDDTVALAAARTLAEAGAEPAIVCAKITKHFQHPNWGQRFDALNVVGKYGEKAIAITPEVVAVLADTNPTVRKEAESILRRIAPEVLTNAPAN